MEEKGKWARGKNRVRQGERKRNRETDREIEREVGEERSHGSSYL